MNLDSNNAAFLPSEPGRANLESGLKTLFVDAVGGSDSNIGSFRDPFQTIARAILEAKNLAGKNTISIAPGSYNENLIVDDYGGLDIRGTGDSPNDVKVNGSAMGTALKIEGGNWINIENLMVINGMNGIYAENVDALTLRNIRSRNNSGYGLHADNINHLDINFSNFLENGSSGASIYNSNWIDIGRSYFSANFGHGIDVGHNQSVLLRHVYSAENGHFYDDLSPPAYVDSYVGYGLHAFGNENLEARGGFFLDNGSDGVHLWDNQNASLFGIQANDNWANGVGGFANQSVDIRGGFFARNQGSGVGLSGFDEYEYVASARAAIENHLTPFIRVIGGRFWDNRNAGLRLSYYDEAEFRAMDVRRNQFHGVAVEQTDTVWMNGIVAMSNQGDGLNLDWVDVITANHISSALNRGDGFDVDGGADKLNVLGGNYSYNDRTGLNLDGSNWNYLRRVGIKGAVAMHNDKSGLTLNGAADATVDSGNFSWNGKQGIDLYNVGNFFAEKVRSRANQLNGLRSDTGIVGGENGENGYPDPVTLHGSLNFKKSYFMDNGEHGVLISSIGAVKDGDSYPQKYRGRTTYDFDLNFDRVISRRNGDSGVFFGRDDDYIVNGTVGTKSSAYENDRKAHVDFDVSFNKGDYSSNGADGIRAEASGIFSNGYKVYATAQTYQTTANHNAGNGLFIDALAPWVEVQSYLEKGAFNFNGRDGVTVWSGGKGFEPNYEPGRSYTDDEGKSHVADFYAKQVVAHNNGANGLNFHSQQTPPVVVGVVPFSSDSLPEDYVAYPLATIEGGLFNNNAMSGINMNVMTDVNTFSGVGSLIHIERAIAKRNGQNGLAIFGQAPFSQAALSNDEIYSRGIQVDIVRGVFNRNKQDGVNVQNVANVNLDRPVGVANHDDGFEGRNLFNVFGDWTFVANWDEDFVLNDVVS